MFAVGGALADAIELALIGDGETDVLQEWPHVRTVAPVCRARHSLREAHAECPYGEPEAAVDVVGTHLHLARARQAVALTGHAPTCRQEKQDAAVGSNCRSSPVRLR